MSTSLAAALAGGPVVLDGGLATTLEDAGHDLSTPEWSARLLHDDPEAILAAHRRFLDAGARVLTAASYQTDEPTLLRRSVELANRARAEHGDSEVWVAASVGPYGAMLADGSEYRGDYGLGVTELRLWHRPRLAALMAAGPDLLALETIPCLAEAEALLAEVGGTGMPCWLSLTCTADRTRAGEPAADGFALARGVAEVVAVGVNCSAPKDASALVAVAGEMSGKPVVVYPNSGERWEGAMRRWSGPVGFDPAMVVGWVADGARLVGGCCRVGPEAIAKLAQACSTAAPLNRP